MLDLDKPKKVQFLRINYKGSNNLKNQRKTNFSQFLNNTFKINKRGSTVGTEVLGGFVNFLVLTYAMIVIPNILATGQLGTDFYNAIYLATILVIIFGTLFLALGANMPLVSAPGIGICSYFAVLISKGTYTFSQTLTIAFIGAILFVILTLLGVREKLVNSLPKVLKTAIPAGIGLFIFNIGLNDSNSGILSFLIEGPSHIINGNVVWPSVVVALIGFMIITYFHIKKVKGSIFLGIVGATLLHFIIQLAMGNDPFVALQSASWLPDLSGMINNTVLSFDFKGLFVGDGSNVFASSMIAIIIILSVLLVDVFDTMGTLFGATKNTSLVKDDGKIVNLNRVLWADSFATMGGTFLGIPGVAVYVESATGIRSGARTGLASLVTALLFAVALFLAPVIMLIPASATAPALMFVGMLMFNSVMDIDFNDITQALPSLVTIIIMPLTGNIAVGIGAGLIVYTFVMVFSNQAKKVNIITYILCAMFILFFATQNIV